MGKQPSLSGEIKHDRVRQQTDATRFEKARSEQKVAVSWHEKYGAPVTGHCQGARAVLFKSWQKGGVITHPNLEQVAKNKNGISWRARHVLMPCSQRKWLCSLQVQV
jgi:hypothetical protein